jgi:hypothetical protein
MRTAPRNLANGPIQDLFERHVADSVLLSKTLPDGICDRVIRPEVVKKVIEQLTWFNFQQGRIPTLQVSSDITLEELEYRGHTLEYTGISMLDPVPASLVGQA